MSGDGSTRTIASTATQTRATTPEELRPDQRVQGVQQLTSVTWKPWTALKSFKAVLKNQNTHVKSGELSSEFTERLLESWFEAFIVYAGEGGAQDRPRGQHRLRNIREHLGELRPGGVSVGHSILLALHGLRTRYVTGALLASRRWLQRRAGIRQVSVPRGLSDATPKGGDAA